ncbi:MAG TPA: hypothetical protein VK137_06060 [Planctomycetaceae bacterium]|nr:hypothetical protein [Planctomycetaceae bacterium]
MNIGRDHITIGGVLLLAGILLLPIAQTSQPVRGVLLSQSGEYVELDSDYKTVKTGALWEDMFESSSQREQLKAFVNLSVLRLTTDVDSNRVFVQVGTPQAEQIAGYLVLRGENLKLIDALRQPMPYGPVGFLIDQRVNKIYLTHLSGTVVYNSKTYQKITESTDPLLLIGRSSCVLDEDSLLYTNGRLFDTRNDGVVRLAAAPRAPSVSVDCKRGRMLLLSRGQDGTVLLTIYDPRLDRLVTEIRTTIPFTANVEGWHLSPDGNVVVWDEETLVPVGEGKMRQKTGRLTFFDVQKSTRIGSAEVPRAAVTDSEILGFSPDSQHVLYRSNDRLVAIRLSTMSVVHEVTLPFRPIGIGWVRVDK